MLFIIAAGTDWLDGYYARKYSQVTTLGRILDPFADKVIICGTFIFLAADPIMVREQWGLRAWMVVVIVGRELLVTVLRSFIEDRGMRFLGQDVGQAEDGFAVRGRRRVPVLSILRPDSRRKSRRTGAGGCWWRRSGRPWSSPSIPARYTSRAAARLLARS